VGIEGRVTRVSATESDEYFATRPLGSRLSAVVSPQSEPVASREALETALEGPPSAGETRRPARRLGWLPSRAGTIRILAGPQRPPARRLCYRKVGGAWKIERLAPEGNQPVRGGRRFGGAPGPEKPRLGALVSAWLRSPAFGIPRLCSWPEVSQTAVQ